ncbi:MAG: exopolysaccharide biosynthesis polyprenyl glycosylphosphotransferase [Sideroxyarcus sp.]|nr:exopolysaccharide biosynthesis polyprenyl glycosylphosphotransferase [Sideroxyarcus sp.]
MNTQPHSLSGDATNPPTQSSVLRTQSSALTSQNSPKRSFAILVALAFIAIGLMILPRPSLYYPNVIIDVTDGMQLDFLLNGRQDKTACETAAAAIVNAITASCRECRTRSQTCTKNLSAELKIRFDETPLPMPSARMANGIITYNSSQATGTPNLSLLACQESERQAVLKGDQAKVACYPANTPRPYTAFEKRQDQTSYTTFTLLLAAVGGLIISLIAAILVTHRRRSLSTQHSALSTSHSPLSTSYSPFPAPYLLQKLTLAGVDTLILLGTFLALSWPEANDINRWSRLDRASVIGHGVTIVLTIGWFWLLLEHYARRRPFWDELREILRVLAAMAMVSGAAAFVAELETGRNSHLIVWALNFLLIPLGRAGARQLLDDLGLWQRPAIIIGTGENARDAYLAIKSERSMGYRILGFVRHCEEAEADAAHPTLPSPASGITNDLAGVFCQPSRMARGSIRGAGGEGESLTINAETFPILDGSQSLEALLSTMGNPQTILALDSLNDPGSQALVQRLLASRTNIHIVPSIRGLPLFGTQISHFFSHEVLFLTVRNNLSRRGFQWIKRAFDIVAASILLVILSPLMAYVAWRIWREDGGPVIFHQPRLARDRDEFGFLKFRSMVKDADKIIAQWRETNSPEWQEYYANNFKLKNDPRVLSVGSWIRSTSIDELPQLINVLRGEMSLVGPRPLLARELPEYGSSIGYYRQARPGITGLWQISGRSQTKFNDRAMLDEWYVQNWSLWYDIVILFKTIDVVFNKRGAH